MLNFAVLGPFGMWDATGVNRTPRPHKLRTMLALLVVNAGQVVPVGQLSRELWPADPPRTAVTAIHVYVSRLRKHLHTHGAGGYLHTMPSGYLFAPEGCRLDLTRFRVATTEAADAEQAGDLESASELLGRALALWDGAALADVRDGVSLRHLARRLDEARLAAYERRIRIDLMLDRHKELAGELYALVEQYPHWENFHGYLMIALYRARRTTEALTAYTRLREWLIDNLGMEPGTEIQRLQQLMLSRDEELDSGTSVNHLPGEGLFARMLGPDRIPLPRTPEML